MSLHEDDRPPGRTPEETEQARPILEQIADRWTVMILAIVCTEPARFNGLRRRLAGITPKALADALKRLERNGLISRTVIPTKPIGVRYAATPLGHSLQRPYDALYDWSMRNREAIEAARAAYDLRMDEDPAF